MLIGALITWQGVARETQDQEEGWKGREKDGTECVADEFLHKLRRGNVRDHYAHKGFWILTIFGKMTKIAFLDFNNFSEKSNKLVFLDFNFFNFWTFPKNE